MKTKFIRPNQAQTRIHIVDPNQSSPTFVVSVCGQVGAKTTDPRVTGTRYYNAPICKTCARVAWGDRL